MGKVFQFRRKTSGWRRGKTADIKYSQIEYYAETRAGSKWGSSGGNFTVRQIIGIMVFAIVVGTSIGAWMAIRPNTAAPGMTFSSDNLSAQFGLCDSGGGSNCVIDGDTIRFRGEKIRIVGIDTPETHPPGCPREAELGPKATQRLQELLNQGPFQFEATARNDRDRYGRLLREVTRGGRPIGDTLISEGLAHPYNGGTKQGWC